MSTVRIRPSLPIKNHSSEWFFIGYKDRDSNRRRRRSAQAVASLTAALAAAGTFVEARCFLCAYREAVPCIFFVMFGLFSLSVMFGLEPDISLTDSPVKPGNDEKEKKLGNDEKEKKLRNDEKEKKAGNDEKEKKSGE